MLLLKIKTIGILVRMPPNRSVFINILNELSIDFNEQMKTAK